MLISSKTAIVSSSTFREVLTTDSRVCQCSGFIHGLRRSVITGSWRKRHEYDLIESHSSRQEPACYITCLQSIFLMWYHFIKTFVIILLLMPYATCTPTLCFMSSTFSLRLGTTLLRGKPSSSWFTRSPYLTICELNCSSSSCLSLLWEWGEHGRTQSSSAERESLHVSVLDTYTIH